MKHVGKMKNNSAKVAVVYRTLPGEPHSALVVGVQGLGDSSHDFLMTAIESEAGQSANELADVLATRRFADGSVMLGYLHGNGHLKKVPTSTVNMTPDSQTIIQLDKLNELIAQQKGIELEDLAITDGSQKKEPTKKEKEAKEKAKAIEISDKPMSASELRSRADALYKEAAALRKEADLLDPPKSKKAKAVAETAE